MRDLPGRLIFTAGLITKLFTPLGAAVVCEVGRNLCHNTADRLDHRATQLRRGGDLFDRLGDAILAALGNHQVEGRTSSGRSRPAQHRGSRKPLGPRDIEASASERRSVASSERSCMEGRPTDISD